MLDQIDSLIAFSAVILLNSLLVTVITQMVVSALNLRGHNLFWGLTRLLREIQPGKNDAIDEIVQKVLKHPLIASTEKRLASVIRSEELSQLLIKFAQQPDAYRLSKGATDWVNDFVKIDEKQLAEHLEALPDKLESMVKDDVVAAYRKITDTLEKSRQKIIQMGVWFDRMSDRMSERFTLRSRWITVISSFAIAFGMQLDSISLMQNIYGNAELRAKLTASVDVLLNKSEQILGQRSTFDVAMDSVRIKTKKLDIPPAPSFINRTSAEAWLAQVKVRSADSTAVKETLISTYDTALAAVTKARLGMMGQEALALRDQLDEMGIKLLSKDYGWNVAKWGSKKIFGILITVALLSLGAPFWFNALRNLANLRTKIMQSEESEREKRKTSGGISE